MVPGDLVPVHPPSERERLVGGFGGLWGEFLAGNRWLKLPGALLGG